MVLVKPAEIPGKNYFLFKLLLILLKYIYFSVQYDS